MTKQKNEELVTAMYLKLKEYKIKEARRELNVARFLVTNEFNYLERADRDFDLDELNDLGDNREERLMNILNSLEHQLSLDEDCLSLIRTVKHYAPLLNQHSHIEAILGGDIDD